MVKNLRNSTVLRPIGAILFVCFAAVSSFGQVAGDYGSRNATGTWGTATDWLVFVSAADWSDATVAATAPGSTRNVFIRSGHSMAVAATGNCLNLKVDGTITGASGIGLNVYGTTATINGSVTLSGGNGIFQARNPSAITANTVKLTGSGTASFARMRPGDNDVTFEVDMDVSLTNTGGYVINANGKSNFTLKINATKTVTCPSTGYVALGSSSSTDQVGPNATFDIAGTLSIPASTNFSLANTTGNTSTLIVRNGGTVNIGGNLNVPSTSAATAMNIKVESGGALTAGTNNVSGATVEYFGNSSMNTVSVFSTIKNLTINNAAGITLSAATTVTNALTLTSGNLTLGANDLTVGSFAGSPSTTSHVIATNSGATGYLKTAFVGNDTKTFPIGATASSYDPFTATPTSATTLGAKVSTIDPAHTLSPTAIAGSREWDVTSTAPSSTVLAFTPGDGRAAPLSGVKLGHWNGSAWDTDIAATYSAGTFTGTASTFSPYIAAELAQPLSMELQNLTAKGRGTTNIVYWVTANEKNNAVFNIERSADGQDFSNIGTIKGKGTTNAVSNYDFTDNAPLNGVNYYRLRAVDTDGKATISKSVSVVNGKTAVGIVKIYPSVSNAILTVDIVSEGISTLIINDLTGKTVLTKTMTQTGFSSNSIDVSAFPNGLYLLRFTSATSQSVQKFIKN